MGKYFLELPGVVLKNYKHENVKRQKLYEIIVTVRLTKTQEEQMLKGDSIVTIAYLLVHGKSL